MMPQRPLPRLICTAIAAALMAGAALATADNGSNAVRVAASAGPPSHLGLRALLAPPSGLIRSLANGEATIKGLHPQAEQELLEALHAAGLRERVLRVAVAEEGGAPVALVKVQAGDVHSRLFSVTQVERDAGHALRAAFALPLAVRHLDFWSVVPEIAKDGTEWHRPVFSVAAERTLYFRLMQNQARPDRDLLARLSAVRQ